MFVLNGIGRRANLARILQDCGLAAEGHRGICSSFLTFNLSPLSLSLDAFNLDAFRSRHLT